MLSFSNFLYHDQVHYDDDTEDELIREFVCFIKIFVKFWTRPARNQRASTSKIKFKYQTKIKKTTMGIIDHIVQMTDIHEFLSGIPFHTV